MEELYARIEDYLDNTMGNADRTEFEAAVQSDPALAESLARVREARERLTRQWAQEDKEAKLRETLKSLGSQHFVSTSKTKRIPIGRWLIAAAAMVAFIVWLAWPNGENGLYQQYRSFPEASFTLKSGEQQVPGDVATAFNAKNYEAALAGLNVYLQQKPDDLEARFFAGLCQLELSRLSEAENAFQQILSGNNAWAPEARWYLALTYLRGKKKESCRDMLLQIPPGEAHYEAAQALLKKI